MRTAPVRRSGNAAVAIRKPHDQAVSQHALDGYSCDGVYSKQGLADMVTPTHMILAAGLFTRRHHRGTLWAALAGGLIPDIPLFLMTLYATRIAGVPAQEVFGRLYFSDSWQRVFSIDHGIFLWGMVCLVAWWSRASLWMAFAGAGLVHALVDFVTHSSDARPQFWPLTDWIFTSPVSYWERDRYAAVVSGVEISVMLALTIWMMFRLERWRERSVVVVVAAIVLGPFVLTGDPHGLHGVG